MYKQTIVASYMCINVMSASKFLKAEFQDWLVKMISG